MTQVHSSIRGSRLPLGVLTACLTAMGAVEVTGINHFERSVIHRDFGAYQFAFFCMLWALTTVFLRRRLARTKPSLLSFLLRGLCAAFISAWLTFPIVGLAKGEWRSIKPVLSWQGFVDSLVVTTVGTFVWLVVGILSGALCFIAVKAFVPETIDVRQG